jgi:hypothetical protein
MRIRRRLLFLTRSRALSGPTAGKGSNCQILTTTLPYLAVISRSRPVREPTLSRPSLSAAISTVRLPARDPPHGHEICVSTLTPETAQLHSGDDLSFPAYKDSAHSRPAGAHPASFLPPDSLGEEYQARNRGTYGTDRGGDHYERPVRSILWLRVNHHVFQTYFILDSCTLSNSSSAPTPLAELQVWMTIPFDESPRLGSN